MPWTPYVHIYQVQENWLGLGRCIKDSLGSGTWFIRPMSKRRTCSGPNSMSSSAAVAVFAAASACVPGLTQTRTRSWPGFLLSLLPITGEVLYTDNIESVTPPRIANQKISNLCRLRYSFLNIHRSNWCEGRTTNYTILHSIQNHIVPCSLTLEFRVNVSDDNSDNTGKPSI